MISDRVNWKRLGWRMQNQQFSVAQTLTSSGDVSVLFVLDLSYYCSVGEVQFISKSLFDININSI